MIKLLRVDHRLLHGQVAFSWTSALSADCILIANDDVMKDELRKTTMKLAQPNGVKLVMKNMEDAIAAINSGVTDKYKLLIVVESIQDAYALAKNCEQVKAINLGGTKVKEGTSKTTCRTCGGTGKIQNASNTAFGNFIRMETCEDCDGTGEYIEEPCEKCHGKGFEVKNRTMKAQIPNGVDNGTIIKISGEGHAGENGGPNGDLYIRIAVKSHEFFERNGYDIYYELPIRFTQAVLGDEMEVPTLTGLERFDLPAGTQSGDMFTLKNKGVQRPHSKHYGDIHFRVNVVIPKNVSKEQKELLKEFDEVDGESTKEQKGFFDKIRDFFD